MAWLRQAGRQMLVTMRLRNNTANHCVFHSSPGLSFHIYFSLSLYYPAVPRIGQPIKQS